MADASPNARHPTPPIFHWELGLRLLPNAKKSTHKKRNVHGRRKKLASANVKYTNMLVYFALGNAKYWRRVYCPTPTPDARYFAFWWNIGFNVYFFGRLHKGKYSFHATTAKILNITTLRYIYWR